MHMYHRSFNNMLVVFRRGNACAKQEQSFADIHFSLASSFFKAYLEGTGDVAAGFLLANKFSPVHLSGKQVAVACP